MNLIQEKGATFNLMDGQRSQSFDHKTPQHRLAAEERKRDDFDSLGPQGNKLIKPMTGELEHDGDEDLDLEKVDEGLKL